MPVKVRGQRLHKGSFNIFYLCFPRRAGGGLLPAEPPLLIRGFALISDRCAALAEWTCPSATRWDSCLPQQRSLRVNGWTFQRAGVTRDGSNVCSVWVAVSECHKKYWGLTAWILMPLYWFTFRGFRGFFFSSSLQPCEVRWKWNFKLKKKYIDPNITISHFNHIGPFYGKQRKYVLRWVGLNGV